MRTASTGQMRGQMRQAGIAALLNQLGAMNGLVGTMDGLDLAAIAPAQRVPAHDRNVLKHAHAVFEIADAGALVVGPAYRHFFHAVAALERDKKDLGIEAPAVD